MSYLPIAKLVPQYVDSNGDTYSGAVLKAYADGTSTNISMATDTTGGTTFTSCALNSNGFPEVSGSIIIPHVDQAYKLALYPDQTSADANSGAIWTIDNIPIIDFSTYFTATETGTGDAYAITITGITSYEEGVRVQFIASEANVGACTVNINSLGATSIKLMDGGDPYDNAILANALVDLFYDGTNFQLLNPNVGSKGSDIASAATTDISLAGDFVDITGTTTITGFGTVKAGTKRTVQFDGSLTITYNATSLILPTGANFVTTAGDVLDFVSLGSGNWLCTNIMERHGTWTPVLIDSTLGDGTSESQTYTTQYGSYSRIGNRVFIHGTLEVNSIGTLTSADPAYIGGLPFTSNSTANTQGGVSITAGASLALDAIGIMISGEIATNTNYIALYQWDTTAGTNAMQIGDYTDGGLMTFFGQYII